MHSGGWWYFSAHILGHPRLWDVLSWRRTATGEEENWHHWDCLLRLPPRKRHLSVSGWEWNLSRKRWRPSRIHCEFTHLSCFLQYYFPLSRSSFGLEWKQSAIISYCCTSMASSLDDPWNVEKASIGMHFHGCRNSGGELQEMVETMAARQDTRFCWFFISSNANKKQHKGSVFFHIVRSHTRDNFGSQAVV